MKVNIKDKKHCPRITQNTQSCKNKTFFRVHLRANLNTIVGTKSVDNDS